jgi:hypothetical protein
MLAEIARMLKAKYRAMAIMLRDESNVTERLIAAMALLGNENAVFHTGDGRQCLPKNYDLLLVDAETRDVPEKQVEVVNINPIMLQWLREDPERISKLSPSKFEDLVLDRLHRMGFGAQKVGNTYARDGGIDLIAWPETQNHEFPFLIAAQVKHHKAGAPVGPAVVREFRGVFEHNRIDMGLIITNTRFTPDAKWVAQQLPRIVRLRDFHALRAWLYDSFDDEVWNEIPDTLTLGPGLTIPIPKMLRRPPGSK